jgi:hypothetical protein
MSLYISMNMPSTSLAKSPIDDAITFVAMHANIESRQGNLPEGPSLDVTFLLPGAHEVPPFSGMRMGGYTREGNTLFFETAVPRHILNSDQAPIYVAAVMQDVVDHAQAFFLENQISFDQDNWQQVIDNLTRSEASPRPTH